MITSLGSQGRWGVLIMRIRYLAALGWAFVVPAAPAFAQDAAAAVAREHGYEMRSQQEALHSDSVDFWSLTGGEVAKRVADYRKATEAFRLNALQVAEQARNSPLPAGTGARIRDALEADLILWHNSLPVDARDWDAMRKQWLVPVGSLTDQQWALQRAAWFGARDAWIDKRVQTARVRP
jgi:hypothetical protein